MKTNKLATHDAEIIDLMNEISSHYYSVKFCTDKDRAVAKYCNNAPDAHVISMNQGEKTWSIFTSPESKQAGTLAALREIVQNLRQTEVYETKDLTEYYTEAEILKSARVIGAAGQPLLDLLGKPSTRCNGFVIFIDAGGEVLTPEQGYAVLFDSINYDWVVIIRSLDDAENMMNALNKLYIMTVAT